MKVKIKRLDKNLPLPKFATPQSAGFDLYSREKVIVLPGKDYIVPSNLIVEPPKGYFLMIAPRSSLFGKKGLILANSVGVIDRDYSGPDDEIGILVYNTRDEEVVIEKGERIAQGIFIRTDQAEWEEVEQIRKISRGGFGSTG